MIGKLKSGARGRSEDSIVSEDVMRRIESMRERCCELNGEELAEAIKDMSRLFAQEVKELTDSDGMGRFCELLMGVVEKGEDRKAVKAAFGCIANVIHSGPDYASVFIEAGIMRCVRRELVEVRDPACELRCYSVLANVMELLKECEEDLKEMIDFDRVFEVMMVKPEKYYECVFFFLQKLIDTFEIGDNLVKVVEFMQEFEEYARQCDDRDRLFMYTRIVRMLTYLVLKYPYLVMPIWDNEIIQNIMQFMDEGSFVLPGEIFDFLDAALRIASQNEKLKGVAEQIIGEVSVSEIVELTTGPCPAAMGKGTALIVRLIQSDMAETIIEERNENGLMRLLFYLMDVAKTEVFSVKLYVSRFLCVMIDKLVTVITHEQDIVNEYVEFVNDIIEEIEDDFAMELLLTLLHVIEHTVVEGDEARQNLVSHIVDSGLASKLAEMKSPKSGPLATRILELFKRSE